MFHQNLSEDSKDMYESSFIAFSEVVLKINHTKLKSKWFNKIQYTSAVLSFIQTWCCYLWTYNGDMSFQKLFSKCFYKHKNEC